MAFPKVTGRAVSELEISSTTFPVSIPAADPGDLIVIAVSVDTNALWVVIDDRGFDDAYVTTWTRLLTKTATGRESEIETFVFENPILATAITLVIKKWDEWEFGGTDNWSAGAPDPDAFAPTWGAASTLWVAVGTMLAGIGATAAPPNYTDLQTATTPVTRRACTAERLLDTDEEDPGAFTVGNSGQWYAYTLAIRGPYTDGWGKITI